MIYIYKLFFTGENFVPPVGVMEGCARSAPLATPIENTQKSSTNPDPHVIYRDRPCTVVPGSVNLAGSGSRPRTFPMKPVIYGIPTCDSVRKARKWFEAESIEYDFVDFRKQAPTREQLGTWLAALGNNALINKRSTTWKQLSDAERNEVEHGDSIAILLAQPTLIKRPLLEYD